MTVRGVIFDLDGTLIDSRLDFDAMRREMGFPAGQPILEGIARLPVGDQRAACLRVLHRHEQEGALRATVIAGADELLRDLEARGVPVAILTRNSRDMTRLALSRLGLRFSQVVTREDAPPKPDPAGLAYICRAWRFAASEVVFVGDFRFDLLTGRAAGVRTVLFAPEEIPDYAHEADHVVRRLLEIPPLLFGNEGGASLRQSGG